MILRESTRTGWHAGCSKAGMATHTKHPSEGWTIPLHVIVWTAIVVGFIMTVVVLMLH
jgi:multisubunit Na+/H+ antiporter MnhC subunit